MPADNAVDDGVAMRHHGGRSEERIVIMTEKTPRRMRWRDYTTEAGGRPVRDFIAALSDDEAVEVIAAMKDVAKNGIVVARHLRGDVYEVRADGPTRSFRVLFAQETRFILLGVHAFEKRTQRTPVAEIDLAEARLESWRARGRRRRRPAKRG